jgi:hypothetical protein
MGRSPAGLGAEGRGWSVRCLPTKWEKYAAAEAAAVVFGLQDEEGRP